MLLTTMTTGMTGNTALGREVTTILCPICRAPNRPDARFCMQCGNDVLLDNIYRLTRVIKEGGMGVVYQAIDDDGEVYAVKEMHDRFTTATERQDGIERFLDEARLLRTLKGHPNIPQVYRSFIDEGRYYLSMEFIFGEDLEDMLKRDQRYPEARVLRWADQLCDVLEFMHSHKFIYRDMKPSNIMITTQDDVKVVDFGIAKLLQPGQRGTMIGTPGYAPPEQYQGLTTPQSDVYALAATLHHLLTGRDPREEPPFSFPPARTIRPAISQRTSDALDKALQMEADERFPNVSAFRRALPILTGDRSTQRFDPARQPQPTLPRRIDVPAPQPVPQPAPRQQPRPQRQAAPQRQAVRRSVRRTVRRAIATGLLVGGLSIGAVQFGPQIVNTVQTYLSGQTVPTGGQVAPVFVTQPFETVVEVQVTSGAADDAVTEALREAYLQKAQQEYPGAQISTNRPLARIGALEELPAAEGFKTYRVNMSGLLNVPQ